MKQFKLVVKSICSVLILWALSTGPAAASQFSIISPGPGDIWSTGSSQTITWSGGDPGWSILISLVDVNAWTVFTVINTSTPNDGDYLWNIPSSIPSGLYLIYIQEVNQLDWKYGANFTIVNQVTSEVTIDIKPQSCPNPLNTKSKGVLPAAILGSADLDVNNIDVSTIRLEGVAPIHSAVEDVSTPVVNGEECECTTNGADGFDDLTLKFDTQEIIAALGTVNDGDEVELTITGDLLDGTPIEGKDCIIIKSKSKGLNKLASKDLPESFSLGQNYPNPFNPTTKIKYDIPERSFTTIIVYDVLGIEVTTLINEEKEVGRYEVEFDATNLPSGIYFYRLRAGEYINTNKMILLR